MENNQKLQDTSKTVFYIAELQDKNSFRIATEILAKTLSLGRLRTKMENIINQYYECKCDVEFLNKNPEDIIVRTHRYGIKNPEINAREIKKILNSMGWSIKEVGILS